MAIGLGKERETDKKIISHEEAQKIVDEVRNRFLSVFERCGMSIEIGKLDGDGAIFTEERIESIKSEIDEATWEALRETSIILKPEPKST